MKSQYVKSLLVFGCLVLTGGMVRGQEELAESDEPIRVDVNLATLRFTVRDERNRFSNRLTERDFSVYENGRLQEPAFFEQPRRTDDRGPLWLAFLLDVSGSTFATRAEEILAATSFFENTQDFTKVGIFGFTDELLTFQDFTEDRRAAMEAFAAARPHLGKTAIYGSLRTLISEFSLQAPSGEGKAVILVSDGMDENYEQVDSVVNLAKENDVAVYTIWVPSAAQLYIGPAGEVAGKALAAEKADKERAFAKLSAETGGRHFGGFEAILDFDGVMAEINDELYGNLYTIGYYTDAPDWKRGERNVDVVTKDPALTVVGVFKDLPDRVEAKRSYIAALFDNESISVLSLGRERFFEIGADIDLLRQRQEGNQASQPFRIKISSFSLRRNDRGNVRTQFGIVGLLTDLDGNEIVRLREIFRANLDEDDLEEGRGIIYTNRFLAPPGQYYLRVALLEIPTWRMTVLDRTVRIRPDGAR